MRVAPVVAERRDAPVFEERDVKTGARQQVAPAHRRRLRFRRSGDGLEPNTAVHGHAQRVNCMLDIEA